jgi:hypothetical protein
VFENMTVSIAPTLEVTASHFSSSFLLQSGYPTINGPYEQMVWQDMNGTEQGGAGVQVVESSVPHSLKPPGLVSTLEPPGLVSTLEPITREKLVSQSLGF